MEGSFTVILRATYSALALAAAAVRPSYPPGHNLMVIKCRRESEAFGRSSSFTRCAVKLILNPPPRSPLPVGTKARPGVFNTRLLIAAAVKQSPPAPQPATAPAAEGRQPPGKILLPRSESRETTAVKPRVGRSVSAVRVLVPKPVSNINSEGCSLLEPCSDCNLTSARSSFKKK